MDGKRQKHFMGGFLKPIAILLFLVAFFIFYNAYLVDNSLEVLNISLDETANAQNPASMEAAKMLLENAVLREVARPDFDLSSFSAIDFASSVANESQNVAQIKSSKFAIQQAIQKKNDARFIVLRWLDWVNREVQNIFYFIKKTIAQVFRGAIEKPKTVLRYELIQDAKNLEKSGDLEEAKKRYESFITLNQGAEGIGLVQTRLAFVEMKLGQYEAARKLLGEVSRSSSTTEARVAENLKNQIQTLEKIATKREELKSQITMVKDPVFLQQLYFDLGQMSMELYDLGGAQDALKKAVDFNPVSTIAEKARFSLGFAYKLTANIQKSEEIFSRLIQTATGKNVKTASSLQLADVKRITGDYQGAAHIMDQVAKTAPDTATAVLSAFGAGYIYLFNLNDTKQSYKSLIYARNLAETKGKASIETSDITVLPLREYAFALFEVGKFKEAKDAFQAVLKADENDAWAQAGLGMIYELEGKRKQAAKLIENGYEIKPDYFTTAVVAYFEERKGNIPQAIELNRRSIKLNTDYLYPYYNLGHIYITQKSYDAAIDILKQGKDLAVKLKKKFPLLQSNLGYCYFQKGELDKAIVMFNEAIKDNPKLVDAWYNRALTYEKKGDLAAYRKDIAQAYQLKPDYKDVQERFAKQAAA